MEPAEHLRPIGAVAAAAPKPEGWPDGWHVLRVERTGSTNDDLLALAGVLEDRTVLFAGHQTAGRGRLDRRWEAPPDVNLLVSILFRTVPTDPGELTRRVGLAVVDTVREFARRTSTGSTTSADHVPTCALKWPNDVLLGDSKLAGILAQRDASGPVVVGCGFNVGWAPEGAARLVDIVDGGASVPPDPASVLDTLLRRYDALPADIAERYRTDLGTLGRRVRIQRSAGDEAGDAVEGGHGDVVGTAVDIDASGRLVVVDDCAITHRIDVGDVIHLRPVGRAEGT